ncbi:MAG: NAD-dependent epimerase/dehydratase [Parcubacteria group bacterium]|nr:NAD-dependent epimerase/dehydratase [Parcubacteria group bacterium]
MTSKALKKKNILVVGGAGYVGGAVTDILMKLEDRYTTRVYDNLTYEESYLKPVDFVFGDILDTKSLKKQLDWADAVIWLAAIVGDGACKWDEVLTKKVNQDSVGWLVKNFKGRIIYTSTCSVYGAQDDVNLTETSLVKPLSLYAYTKHESEKLLKNSDAVIFRLGTLFGTSDAFSRVRMDLVANLLTARAALGGGLSIFGGAQFRPLLHVKDAAQAMVDALEAKETPKAEIYNLCQTNMKILDLARRVKKFYPKAKLEITKMPFEDTRNYQVSAEKAKKALNFAPSHTIDDGIVEIGTLLKSRRIKDFNNPRYSNQVFLKDVLKK